VCLNTNRQSATLVAHPPVHTESHTLALHDALPICRGRMQEGRGGEAALGQAARLDAAEDFGEVVLRTGEIHLVEHGDVLPRRIVDRKSTRLNSSHVKISYAVFCLKKKKKVTLDTPG